MLQNQSQAFSVERQGRLAHLYADALQQLVGQANDIGTAFAKRWGILSGITFRR